ncbi:zinc-binding oxidoreductase ToxD [Rickenella mellea]|uniref:Zinc-binding oxidoreductase ToxD n=1 Tax=Rickenella mellea TaxID=50990 RepID=A0A4Y7Q536_9AGAM|nr:zinc-binding oxidoreductase ToxD [Rickenella mellea]
MAPTKMKAVVALGDGTFQIKEVDVPKPGPRQVLVKVAAAAQNPSDWKTVQFFPIRDAVLGSDFAGTVEEIGPDVPSGTRKVGERVAGFIQGSSSPNGTYAEYVLADANVIISIPESWTFEQAAQLGIATYTTCQVLYQSQSLPTPLEPTKEPVDILVWGGASGVGQFVIQFAHLAGLRVIATASTKNFELLKSYGAVEVFDYKDESTPAKIKEFTGGKLKHAVDCIAEKGTPETVHAALSDNGGVISALLGYASQRDSVVVTPSIVYPLLGRDFDIPMKMPADAGAYELGKKFSKLISDVLATGKVKPIPVKLMPNGLASVKEGFEYMKEGHVSGEKITYRISDTP